MHIAGGSTDKPKEKKVVEDDLESAMGPVDAAVQESRSEMARVSCLCMQTCMCIYTYACICVYLPCMYVCICIYTMIYRYR
jgi:hypothetical protein